MTMPGSTQSMSGTPSAPPSRRGQLAIALQEVFTAVARLRSNRQVAADAESFRARIKQVLATSEQGARQWGYSTDDVRLALFGVVVFTDESVLNSNQPMFAGWGQRPLQDEVFGAHTGGELFFQYLQQMLQRPDSEDVADLIEVYQLCILLGFRGRYGSGGGSELQGVVNLVAQRLQRIRGAAGELSPLWRPSTEAVRVPADRWVPRLTVVAGISLVLAVGAYAFFLISLSGQHTQLQTALGQLVK